MTMKIPLKHPEPNIKDFKEVILRRKASRRVHFIEIHIDKEVIRYITEKKLKKKWIEPSLGDRKAEEEYLKNYIDYWYRLGYDGIRVSGDFRLSAGLVFKKKVRKGKDRDSLSQERNWAEEGRGIISSWEDFEKYPWPSLDKINLWSFEFISKNLPEGMGIFGCPCMGILEIVENELLGYENLCYLLYDNPELVKATFNKVGELIYGWYKKIIGLEKLVGFFQGDDMGFKTATLFSPEFLRKYVLPWHKKIAQLAHAHSLLYLLHTCGYIEPIIEDLIQDVKIDAKHSFEDGITPVTQFKKEYGDRISALGGVDMDKMCRLKESELRKYVRDILDKCMPGRGYALGSGNSIANYIPVENYLTMLDEGAKWEDGSR